jgi:hypothetical protein
MNQTHAERKEDEREQHLRKSKCVVVVRVRGSAATKKKVNMRE